MESIQAVKYFEFLLGSAGKLKIDLGKVTGLLALPDDEWEDSQLALHSSRMLLEQLGPEAIGWYLVSENVENGFAFLGDEM